MLIGRRTFGLALAAGLQGAPADLLGAVSRRYAALGSYSVEIQSWMEADSLERGRSVSRLAYLDSAHFRFDGPGSVIVADGAFRWQYRAEGREYLREAVGDSRILGEFERLREQYVGRFRRLGELVPLATAKGEQRVPGTRLVLPMVAIAPASGEWMEELWVDGAVVVRSRFSRELSVRGRRWRVNHFVWGPGLAAGDFRFVVPKKARLVERFSVPLGVPVVVPL